MKQMILMNKGYCYAFLTAICWSTSGLFIKCIHQSAFLILGVTSLIALIFNYLYYHKKSVWNSFSILVGICQFFMAITFILANQLTTVGNAIVLQYSSLIFVLVFESIDKRKIPELNRLFVIVLAMIGMFVFFIDEFNTKAVFGNFLAILSGFFFGLQFYLNTKPQSVPVTSIRMQYYLSVLIMLIYLVFTKKSFEVGGDDVLFLFLSGVIQTAIAGILFANCIIRISGFSANVICMSEIFMAPLWAFLFLNERFTYCSIIGAFLMIVALLINIFIDYHNLMKKKEVEACTIV